VITTVAAAVGLFAGTNVDDAVVLTVLFLAARADGPPRLTRRSWTYLVPSRANH
jgi:cadmium resistance protein CadD (predicted permease)